MKVLVALLILAVVALSVSESPETLYPGWPPCEPGTHTYTSACGPKMPEATCDQPNPVIEPGYHCNFIACYCDAPTVRYEALNKCVKLEDCPIE